MDDTLIQALRAPRLRLHGEVDDSWIDRFNDALADTPPQEIFSVEATTTGGDAEVGRRLALEVGLQRARGRRLAFLGKTVVYSAGATVMGGFLKDERWLTADACLLIHGRQMTKHIHLDGPLYACREQLNKAMAEIEIGMHLERDGFEALAAGSMLSVDEMPERARNNWYLSAKEARDLGLVAGLFQG